MRSPRLLKRALTADLAAGLHGCAWLDLKQRQFIFQPTEEITGTPGWNIGDSAYNTARLRRIGFSVLAIDYRGFGRSRGAFPSEAQVYEDAQAGWEDLKTRHADAKRRFVYGHSLGGAVAIDLTARNPDIGGLIGESSFTSIGDLARDIHGLGLLPLDWLLTQRFDSLAKIGSIAMPMLFLHGSADATVPVSMGERL